jgi:DNA-directed RNA polymerase specialized sigma24 family protein
MDLSLRGSVTGWLDQLKAGDKAAAQELWERYFARLVTLAGHRLRGVRRDVDEEDVALSALKSALLGVQNNRFPNLNDRSELWPLLVTITARKAANEWKRQHVQKRDPSMEIAIPDDEWIAGNEPTPDFALRITEAIQTLVRELGDETLRTIAHQKLEGYSNEEIAKTLNVSTRTVVRKLARIRLEWLED